MTFKKTPFFKFLQKAAKSPSASCSKFPRNEIFEEFVPEQFTIEGFLAAFCENLEKALFLNCKTTWGQTATYFDETLKIFFHYLIL